MLANVSFKTGLGGKAMSMESQTFIASTRYSLVSGIEKKATVARIMLSRK